MKWNLPKLFTEVDCAPIGYAGLRVTFWLNPTSIDYEAPEHGEPWESDYWFGLGRIIESVTVPADLTEGGEEQVIPVPDGKTLWDLMDEPGFDQHIILWSVAQYQKERQDRLQTERKN